MAMVATAFAVFLNSVGHSAAIQTMTAEHSPTQQYKVAFGRSLIDFQIKRGYIEPTSVCRQTSIGTQKQCLTQATRLFSETCKQLQLKGFQDTPSSPAHSFCKASLQDFGSAPSISLVSQDKSDSAFLARQQCSEFTLRAERTGSGVHAQLRDAACYKAKTLIKQTLPSHQMASR